MDNISHALGAILYPPSRRHIQSASRGRRKIGCSTADVTCCLPADIHPRNRQTAALRSLISGSINA
jgi:hypothetical protein